MGGYKTVTLTSDYGGPSRHPGSVSSLSQPSPLSTDTSPPREGEPRDVPPPDFKPQVTFAKSISSLSSPVNQVRQHHSDSSPLSNHQHHDSSPVSVATVRPVPNRTATGYSSNASKTSPTYHHNYSTSSSQYSPSRNPTGNSAHFLQQFNSWKQNKQNPTATVRPLSSSVNVNNSSSAAMDSGQLKKGGPKSALKTKRSNPRRQTISSSQPAVWHESHSGKKGNFNSPAGDLISGVRLVCWCF